MGLKPSKRIAALLSAALLGLTLGGCETDSFLDPSVVGRWERTPVVLPILDQLDIVESQVEGPPGLSGVRSGDLVPEVARDLIQPGDQIRVSIYELLNPNQESAFDRQVTPTGELRLPVLGAVQAQGLAPQQLEQRITERLREGGVLREPMVSVTLVESQYRTFSVISEPRVAGTAIGTYRILGNEFRLLQALALARGVPGQIKKVFVIRQAQYPPAIRSDEQEQAQAQREVQTQQQAQPEAAPTDQAALIEELLAVNEPAAAQPPAETPAQAPAPDALEESLQARPNANAWVNVDGEWVKMDSEAQMAQAGPAASAADDDEARMPAVAQRIIEIPYDKLLDGDMRYNIIVRPGDIIRVPAPVIGNVYIGGAISRPGTYSLPGDQDLTLKQLIFAAGNLSPMAIPERVDLIRRIDAQQEAVVRLDLRAIFEGNQPDIFLKPNDTINIGTNAVAPLLAVVRNGFRTTYGFGFILDRNFGFDVFGAQNINNAN